MEAIDRENRMSIILDMMERNCPLLMKAGGGGLQTEQLTWGKRVTRRQITEIRALYRKNKSPHETAEITGASIATVYRQTRDLRLRDKTCRLSS